jgi:hypothetical protein
MSVEYAVNKLVKSSMLLDRLLLGDILIQLTSDPSNSNIFTWTTFVQTIQVSRESQSPPEALRSLKRSTLTSRPQNTTPGSPLSLHLPSLETKVYKGRLAPPEKNENPFIRDIIGSHPSALSQTSHTETPFINGTSGSRPGSADVDNFSHSESHRRVSSLSG